MRAFAPRACLVLATVLSWITGGFAHADPPDEAVLRQRADNIERLIASLESELAHVRGQLATLPSGKGVTPQQAVEQFQRFPKTPVTVEFGVEPIGYPDVLIRPGDDPEPAIWATWDNRLIGGGTLTAIIPPAVYRQLQLPSADGAKTPLTPGQERAQVVSHIEKHGVRVTGILEPTGFHDRDYLIHVSDPAKVSLYIKGSGQ